MPECTGIQAAMPIGSPGNPILKTFMEFLGGVLQSARRIDLQMYADRMGNCFMCRTSLLAALIFSTSLSFGQTGLATVTATITDTSGAVVANAPVL
jgi:hypothetical protein